MPLSHWERGRGEGRGRLIIASCKGYPTFTEGGVPLVGTGLLVLLEVFKMAVDNIKLLRNVPLFSELTPQEIMMVVIASESVWYGKGDLIIREDSEGDALFVIKSGEVRITKYDGMGNERELALLQPGEHFGELALIQDLPRSASAYAKKDCELLRIPRPALQNLLINHQDIERKFYKAFTRILAERLRRLNDNFTFCMEMSDLLRETEDEEGAEKQ